MAFTKVGIIGAGVMGEAMIVGLSRSGFAGNSIVIREKRAERVSALSSKYGVEAGSLAECDLLILAVKPQDAISTLAEIKGEVKSGALLVSLLAGTKTVKIESALGSGVRVVRVMANTPLLLGKGAAAVTKGSGATSADVAWVIELLSKSGVAIEVSEDLMDAVTATSGSGPAYVFRFVEAMVAAGVKLGLSESDATLLANETLIGAAKMVEESGKDVGTLRANVTSPNGTTAAALASMEASGFEELIYNAMKAARDRSIELSE